MPRVPDDDRSKLAETEGRELEFLRLGKIENAGDAEIGVAYDLGEDG